MKSASFIFLFFICVSAIHGQDIPPYTKGEMLNTISSNQPRLNGTEICGNNIDDDGNGLTDAEDFSCNFNPGSCQPNPVIWGCSADGRLFWVNMATGVQRFVATTTTYFSDLSWGADGKLYGARGSLWEIDPITGAAHEVGILPGGYSIGNSMTADNAGNLYMVAALPPFEFHLIKFNLLTWQVCFIADIKALGLSSAGDLTFLNGALYLSCGNNEIAKINIKTGDVQPITVNNSSTGGYYGLTTIGDGFFYVSHDNKLYRVDPSTMTAESSPSVVFNFPNLYFNGLATYAEICYAPQCQAKINIRASAASPYCIGEIVTLKAENTSCNASNGIYTWTDPYGNTLVNDTINAMIAGRYYLRYTVTGDTCSSIDSFLVEYMLPPSVDLGKDTSLCDGDDILLRPVSIAGLSYFRWQDGSTKNQLLATAPGWYWVETDNVDGCGPVRDSLYIRKETTGCDAFIYVPTAFSPGNDGLNDIFKAELIGRMSRLGTFELSVFNRWGQKIFTSRDILQGWDGTINGTRQASGIYAWICKYRLKNKPEKIVKGTMTLVR